MRGEVIRFENHFITLVFLPISLLLNVFNDFFLKKDIAPASNRPNSTAKTRGTTLLKAASKPPVIASRAATISAGAITLSCELLYQGVKATAIATALRL